VTPETPLAGIELPPTNRPPTREPKVFQQTIMQVTTHVHTCS